MTLNVCNQLYCSIDICGKLEHMRMNVLYLLISVVATTLLYFTDSNILFWISLNILAILLWSYGVIQRYAYDSAVRRHNMTVDFLHENGHHEEAEIIKCSNVEIDIIDEKAAPEVISQINMGATLTAFVFVIIGAVELVL